MKNLFKFDDNLTKRERQALSSFIIVVYSSIIIFAVLICLILI